MHALNPKFTYDAFYVLNKNKSFHSQVNSVRSIAISEPITPPFDGCVI